MTDIRPLAYGYMRVPEGLGDRAIRTVEVALHDYAENAGYCFGTIFHEYDDGTRRAFYELLDALKRSDAHQVIVPSHEHLSRNGILRACMVAQLEERADAHVLELGD